MGNNTPHIQPATGTVNIEDLNVALQQTFIHIDLTKTFFTITPSELTVLDDGASNIWKDVTLASFGLGLPTIINAVVEINKLVCFTFNTEIFLNSLIGSICIISSIICGILWYKSTNKCAKLIEELKNRPQYKV